MKLRVTPLSGLYSKMRMCSSPFRWRFRGAGLDGPRSKGLLHSGLAAGTNKLPLTIPRSSPAGQLLRETIFRISNQSHGQPQSCRDSDAAFFRYTQVRDEVCTTK